MGKRTLVLVVALVLAAIAGFAVWVFLNNVEDDIRANQELVTVFRSSRLIQEGESGDILIQDFGQDGSAVIESQEETQFRPVGAFGSIEELRAFMVGRVAAGPVSENQILTVDQFVQITVDIKPLSESIPEGKQAITILASGERGVNGFVRPGDRINLIVTISFPIEPEEDSSIISSQLPPDVTPEGDEEQVEIPEVIVSRFVLQGIPVLAIGDEIRVDLEEGQLPTVDASPDTAPVEGEEAQVQRVDLMTLEVTPEEAEKIVFSHEQGSVWLTLVPVDFTPVPTEGITRDTLFPLDEDEG